MHARGPERPTSVFTHVAVTLGILAGGVAFFGPGPGAYGALMFGFVACFAAVPYTLVAIVVREASARRAGSAVGRASDGREEAATNFALYAQRGSLVNAVVMLAALVVGVLTGGPFADSGDERELISMSSLIWGAIAAVTGAFSIMVNAPLIYRSSVAGAERRAIQERVGAWRPILATRILTTASWIGACAFAVVFLIVGW